jgi:glycosyltransferase 2 family protein
VAQLARAAGVISLLALFTAVAVVAAPLTAERAVRWVMPHAHLADRIIDLIEGVRRGLVVLRSPARLAGVVVWSLVLWLMNALAFYVGFSAFGIPVSFEGALLLQGLLVLGISIPSTPGFFGPFEAVIVAVLALYGVPGSLAFSYAISFHITSFVPITLLGVWSMVRTPGGLGALRRNPA